MKYLIIFLLSLMIFGQGCYYDKANPLMMPPPCDTTRAATYSGDLKPLLSSVCTGCHSGSAPAGNVKLDQYGPVRDMASFGLLLHVIKHDTGYSAMPKNGGKLNDCSISLISRWIAAGMPNN